MKRSVRYIIIIGILIAGIAFTVYRFYSNQPYRQVLRHYSVHPEDSLKLRAAHFLIDHMQWHAGISNFLTDRNGKRVERNFDAYKHGKNDTSFLHYFKTEGLRFEKGTPVPDRDVVTDDYLIENIDLAFEVWQKPWAKHLTFDEFCEFLLPYRVLTEPVSNWRRHFYEKYKWIEDSVPNPNSTYDVCVFMQNVLKKEVAYSEMFQSIQSGILDPFEMEKMRYAVCDPLATYSILVMRAIGIPLCYYNITFWGIYNSGHSMNLLLANDSTRVYTFGVTDAPPDNGKSSHNAIARGGIATYAHQYNELLETRGNEELPPYLLHPCFKGMESFFCTTDTLHIPAEAQWEEHPFIFLCTFNNGMWQPFKAARIKEKKITFPNTTYDLLYALGAYQNGQTTLLSKPFIYFGKDSIQYRQNDGKMIAAVDMPFLAEGEIKMEKEIEVSYLDGEKWIPVKGVGKLGEMGGDNKWIPCKNIYDKEAWRAFYYNVHLENVPHHTLFYVGGDNRVIIITDEGEWKKY